MNKTPKAKVINFPSTALQSYKSDFSLKEKFAIKVKSFKKKTAL